MHSACAIRIGLTLTEVVMFGGLSEADSTLPDTGILQFSEWCGVCRMCADEGGKEGKCGEGEIGKRG